MGLLGFLGTLFAGAVVVADDIKKDCLTSEWKQQAIQKGQKTYCGYDSKSRYAEMSVETNEHVISAIEQGRRVKVGVKTGRIYRDITQEMLDKQNAELKAKGKLFHFEYFPQWTLDGRPEKLPVENSTGKPFRVFWYKSCYSNKYIHSLRYYDVNNKSYFPTLEKNTGRELSEDEHNLYVL